MPVFGENLGERRVISETDPSEIRHAWFSKKMCLADCGEVALYEMEDGTVKEITCVSLTAEHGCGQDDMQFVGKTTTSGYRGRKLAMPLVEEWDREIRCVLKKNAAIKVRFLDEMNVKYLYHNIPKPTTGEILTE